MTISQKGANYTLRFWLVSSWPCVPLNVMIVGCIPVNILIQNIIETYFWCSHQHQKALFFPQKKRADFIMFHPPIPFREGECGLLPEESSWGQPTCWLSWWVNSTSFRPRELGTPWIRWNSWWRDGRGWISHPEVPKNEVGISCYKWSVNDTYLPLWMDYRSAFGLIIDGLWGFYLMPRLDYPSSWHYLFHLETLRLHQPLVQAREWQTRAEPWWCNVHRTQKV